MIIFPILLEMTKDSKAFLGDTSYCDVILKGLMKYSSQFFIRIYL